MKLAKAYTYLADVQEHKQVIPFRRFAGGIGRASQAKQFGTTKGQSALALSPFGLLPRQRRPVSVRRIHLSLSLGMLLGCGRVSSEMSVVVAATCNSKLTLYPRFLV